MIMKRCEKPSLRKADGGPSCTYAALAFLCALAALCLISVSPAPALAEESADLAREDQSAVEKANLAIVAQASTSFVRGKGRLHYLNDSDASGGGGWHGQFGTEGDSETHWIQYEWKRPVSIDGTEIYWWDSQYRGFEVPVPKSARLLCWTDSGFVPVDVPGGLSLAPRKMERAAFEKIRTTKVRLEFGGDEGFTRYAISEWRVFDAGDSPEFAPVVDAGVDRVVVQGGRTWFDPQRKSIPSALKDVETWSNLSSPGSLAFEYVERPFADAPVPSALVEEIGEHTIRFAVDRGGEDQSFSDVRLKVVPPPPAVPLQPIPTLRYSLDNPLWEDRAKALVTAWIPHCIEKISDPETKSGNLLNYVNAAKALAGEPHGEHVGAVFADTAPLNTLESICIALMLDPGDDPEMIDAQAFLRKTLEEWVPLFLAAQEPDGYFQTAYTLRDPERWRERWAPGGRSRHEGYIAGYFIGAGLAHHMLTNGEDDRFYEAAKRLADCWVDNIGPAPKKEWYDGHQEMEQTLVRLGQYVNAVEGDGEGDKYFELAKFLLDSRKGGREYDQSHLPAVMQYDARGHAVRAVYSYSGMAGVAMETGDVDYQSAVLSLWDNMVNRKYYVTGGIGSGETSEGFGPDYSLRHNAYCESCSGSGLLFFLHKTGMMLHDARSADLYEDTIYNAILGSIDLAGKNFYYQNPLDSRNGRYEWHVCPCCVGNIPRTLLSLPTWTYLKGEDAIYVNLFIGSTMTVPGVAGMDVEMRQITDYPWDGNVEIVLDPERAAEFAVHVRVPDRSVSELYRSEPEANGVESFRLNGEQVEPAVRNGYAVFERRWEPGDKIEFVLPMKVQRVRAIDKVDATRGQVALRYGPLVYNVERVDQDIDGILEPDAPLKAVRRPDFLGGMVVVEGKWADGSPLLAIPNYARQNREIVEDEDASRFGGPGTQGSGQEETEAARAERRRRLIESSVWIRESPDAP